MQTIYYKFDGQTIRAKLSDSHFLLFENLRQERSEEFGVKYSRQNMIDEIIFKYLEDQDFASAKKKYELLVENLTDRLNGLEKDIELLLKIIAVNYNPETEKIILENFKNQKNEN